MGQRIHALSCCDLSRLTRCRLLKFRLRQIARQSSEQKKRIVRESQIRLMPGRKTSGPTIEVMSLPTCVVVKFAQTTEHLPRELARLP
jgi:hypothetical protein